MRVRSPLPTLPTASNLTSRTSQPSHKKPTPFGTSSQRFTQNGNGVGASPGSYEINDTMAKELEKKLVSRNGAFGSSSKRFPKWEADTVGSKSAPGSSGGLKLATGDAAAPPARPKNNAKPFKGRPERNFLQKAGAASGSAKTSSFASKSNRFQRSGGDHAPPPGTYDVSLPWKARNVVPLHSGPADRIKQETSETGNVGPAQYNIKSSFGKGSGVRNRKDILVSTQSRFDAKGYGNDVPGPSSYYPEYAMGGMIRPTFNIAIAEASRSNN